jgi:dihydroorotate dehydrogenase (fumarate)
MALRLDQAGADGLVLFNRFLQPDIDPESLAVMPAVDLSSPREGRLPRTWISILRRRVRASLAGTTGVDGPSDVVKYLLAGADVVMTASALIRHGPEHAAVLLDGLSEWMARKEFTSVGELRGKLAVPAGDDQAGYERAGYVSALRAANTAQGPW